ncbi:MAG: hypothetical protein A2017_13385 [Lentisphaerae bacterium GWF2_44_16]|nr:MAG: hypothetical protein A2017_13385 [Lentisphaerae bacterium GWF2_44_16]
MTEFFRSCFSEIWLITCQMAPSLLFGFLFAGILSVFVAPEYIRKHLGNKGFISVLKASIFGVPLPLCSCGVLPVAALLRKSGASRGSVSSFLISTPQTGVDSIMVTYAMLGPVFAVFRPLAALVSGVFGGMLTDYFGNDGTEDIKKTEILPSETEDIVPASGNRVIEVFRYAYITLLGDIARPLVAGIVIAALISMLVPREWFNTVLPSDFLQMLMMLLLSLPMYVCATASVPIAVALIAKGVSPGAALVFLMAGPVTNAAAVATVWKILGKRSAIIYFLSIVTAALASGFALNFLYDLVPRADLAAHIHQDGISLTGGLSGILLSVLILYSFCGRFFKAGKNDVPGTDFFEMTVGGMTCSHCKSSLEKVLSGMNGVEKVVVEMPSGITRIFFRKGILPDTELIRKNVESLGFSMNVEK